MAAETSSQGGECLKQCGPWLCEYSGPLRGMDVCLNSLRLGTELWESVLLLHFGYYRKLLAYRNAYSYNAYRNAYSYTGYYRKVIGLATFPCKSVHRRIWGGKAELFSCIVSVLLPNENCWQTLASWHQLYLGRSWLTNVSLKAATCSTHDQRRKQALHFLSFMS